LLTLIVSYLGYWERSYSFLGSSQPQPLQLNSGAESFF
jgi:hypothetical protein